MTTGLPKAIVHGHGIVLEHLKLMVLHMDLRPGERFCWMTTTGWIMWNLQVGVLLQGVTTVLFDGNPLHPDPGTLWRVVAETPAGYTPTASNAGPVVGLKTGS